MEFSLIKRNPEKLVAISTRGIFDSNVKGINANKALHVSGTGKAQRVKKIREEKIKELTDYIKIIKAVDVIVPRDFNEDACSKNTQEFMIEVGLFYFFDEINSVEKQQRDPMFECGSKCTDF